MLAQHAEVVVRTPVPHPLVHLTLVIPALGMRKRNVKVEITYKGSLGNKEVEITFKGSLGNKAPVST